MIRRLPHRKGLMALLLPFIDIRDDLVHSYVPGPVGYLVEYVDGALLGHQWNAWDLTAGSGGPTVTGNPSAVFTIVAG